MENISTLSLVISTLLPMIVGFIYYSKPIFGYAWMSSLHISEEQLSERKMGLVLIFSMLFSFLITFFLFANVNGIGQDIEAFDTFKHGALHGGFLGLMVAVPVLFINGLFEKNNFKNLLINSLYWFITLSLMGGVLDAMNTIPESFFVH